MKVTLGALTEAEARYLGFTDVSPASSKAISPSPASATPASVCSACCLASSASACQPLLRLVEPFAPALAQSRAAGAQCRELRAHCTARSRCSRRARHVASASVLARKLRSSASAYLLDPLTAVANLFGCGLGFLKYSLGPRGNSAYVLLNYSRGRRGL